MVFWMIAGFFVLLIAGVPIAFAMGSSAITYMILQDISLKWAAQRFFTNTQSFPFLAVPFFILCASLMIKCGVAKKIINFSNSLVRHLPGGLALVSIVTSMIMAGVSGSSVADASGVGSILIPAMKKEGYDPSFSSTINATSSVVGIIIPPSSTMVIIGWLANISVARLFLAGAFPGILISVLFFLVTIVISRKRNYPRGKMSSFKEIITNLYDSIWALILPIFIVGGIVFGIATVTEIAAVSSFYSLFLGIFIYRSLDLKTIYEALKESAYATAIVLMIVCSSSIFTWVLISENVPALIYSLVAGAGLSSTLQVLIMISIMLVAGTFMGLIPNLFLLVPVFFPIAIDLGINEIQFGILMLVTLAIGLFTPPVGVTLYISCHLANIGIEETLKDLIPYFIVCVIVCLIIAFYSPITLWLPELLM